MLTRNLVYVAKGHSDFVLVSAPQLQINSRVCETTDYRKIRAVTDALILTLLKS